MPSRKIYSSRSTSLTQAVPSSPAFLPQPIDSNPYPALAAIPADFNLDGQNDLLFVYPNEAGQFRFQIVLITGCREDKPCQKLQEILSDFLLDSPDVTLIDPLGSRVPSLLVFKDGQPIVLSQTVNGSYVAVPDVVGGLKRLSGPDTGYQPSLIDFDGDCLSDLVVVEQQSNQVHFLRKQGAKYFLNKSLAYGESVLALQWGDMNFDGSVDIVTVVRGVDGDYLRVHFNDFGDRLYTDFCKAFPAFPFSAPNSSNTFRTPLNGTFLAHSLRLPDINIDGYPDVSLVVGGQPLVLLNARCVQCTDINMKTLDRATLLNRQYLNLAVLSQFTFKNVTCLAAFDYRQNGNVDFFIGHQGPSGPALALLQLTTSYDAFMLKVLPLSGFGDDMQNGNAFGVTLHWLVTTINGNYVQSVGNQLTHPSSFKLQLPYVLSGLGRTNNYVENLFAGFGQEEGNTKMWTPIIPNSQLILTPATQDPALWQINIYIKPTDKIYLVLLITAGILLVLALLILYYHRQEKDQDNRARQPFFNMLVR